MKKLIKQNEVVENKLELFLKSNEEFEFKKLFTEHPVFDTYEIKRKVEGKNRKLTVLEIVRNNGRKEYRFITTKTCHDFFKNVFKNKRSIENGFETYGMNLPLNKLLVWLKDPENELLWFDEN